MKVAWADLKNQNKHSFTDKEKHEDGFSFSESDQSAYQETSAATSDFNHLSKNYVNYIPTDLSAGMMVQTVVDRVVDSDLGSSSKYCSNTNIIFYN